MTWPELQPVRATLCEAAQRLEEQLGAGPHASFGTGNLLEQVRPANVADENEIAGQRADLLSGLQRVGDEEGEMLRRMPRSMHRFDADMTDGKRVPVLQERCACFARELVLPVLTDLSGQQQLRSGESREFARPRQVVGVNVGFRDVRDAQASRACRGNVLGDVPVGIDNQRFAGLLAANEVAGLSKPLMEEALQEHLRSSTTGWAGPCRICLKPTSCGVAAATRNSQGAPLRGHLQEKRP